MVLDKKHLLLTCSSIIFLYLYSVGIRFLCFDTVYESMKVFNGVPIISSNDGLRYAMQAKNYTLGLPSEEIRSVAILASFLAKVLPFSIDSIMFYMPPFFASFVVVAFVLLGREFNSLLLGILSALFFVGTEAFFNRTALGYFDDDMLSLVMPVFVIFFLIRSLKSKTVFGFVLLFLCNSFYLWWYTQAMTILLFFAISTFLYIFVRSRYDYSSYAVVVVFVISILPLAIFYKLLGLVLFLLILQVNSRVVYIALAIFICIFAVYVFYKYDFSMVTGHINSYIFRANTSSIGGLYYASSFDYVQEANAIELKTFITTTSHNNVFFVLGLAALFLAFKRDTYAYFFIPTLFLGFISMTGGSRFSPYAAISISFGVAFFIVYLSDKFKNSRDKFVISICAFLGFAYLGETYGKGYKTFPMAVNASEALSYKALGATVDKNSLVFSFWSYGAPIQYFSRLNTYSDSGSNSDGHIFVESKIFCSTPQRQAYNLMLEASVAGYDFNKSNINAPRSAIESIMKEHEDLNITNPNKMLDMLGNTKFIPHKNSRDIILVLPFKAQYAFATFQRIVSVDLATGKLKPFPSYAFYNKCADELDRIYITDTRYIDKNQARIVDGNFSDEISSIHFVDYSSDGKSTVRSINFQKNGKHVIVEQQHNTVLVMDDTSFYSTYIQMFFFDNYDKKLFTPVLSNGVIKVFKLIQ